MHYRGEMVRGTAPFDIDCAGIHFRLGKVPTWVYTQCGENYFEEADVNAIQDTITVIDQQASKLTRIA